MTAVDAAAALDSELADLAQQFVTWLETGTRPDGMFGEDVLADLSVPQWRVQTQGADATFHLREDDHPFQGEVRVEALDRTARGFLIQFEERWAAGGQRWYCRDPLHGERRSDH
jgi:ABC-type oligopeptide transport system substrate-binding subunit